MSLSEAQKRAVAHAAGPCICLAGPGSGKTTVITQRVKYLIENRDIPPAGILVITFTKAAATEMRERFTRLMGGKRLPVTFGTFHAVFFGILKNAYGFTAANILREEQKHQYLKEIIDGLRLEIEDEGEFLSGIIMEISTVKNNRISLDHYYSSNCSEEVFRQIYEKYQQKLQYSRLLDFDDMLVYTYELFRERKDILALWQKRFPFILVDEYQDVSRLQYEIVKMMAEPKRNLFAVGDDDQSIYRFRGAAPQVMQAFAKDYPEAAHIVLEVNYRCAADIVEKSGRVIANNRLRFAKKIVAVRETEHAVFVRKFKNQREENLAVIEGIRRFVAEGGSYSQVAVLFRTNTQPRLLMEQLLEYNIPFKTRDKVPDIYDHWIARDIFAYMRIAQGSRQRADFLQIMNRPKRYIGRDSLEEKTVAFDVWADYYSKNDQEWIAERIDRLAYDCKMLKDMSCYAAINYIRRGIGYDDYLKEYADYRQIRQEELFEILEELQEAAKEYPDYASWQEHIAEYRKELQAQALQAMQEEDRVALSTFHSAKGLEYDEVYIIDVNEKIIPYKKAVLEEDVEEERRMFYVGMTRARSRLNLYWVDTMNNHEMEPSRFLQEIGEK